MDSKRRRRQIALGIALTGLLLSGVWWLRARAAPNLPRHPPSPVRLQAWLMTPSPVFAPVTRADHQEN